MILSTNRINTPTKGRDCQTGKKKDNHTLHIRNTIDFLTFKELFPSRQPGEKKALKIHEFSWTHKRFEIAE